MSLFGGIEGGGTHFVCAVGKGPDDFHKEEFGTSTPSKTLPRVIEFFRVQQEARHEPLQAIGIGSFGPIDLDRSSRTFGLITETPKRGWEWTDLVGAIRNGLGNVPIAFDTDVNAAALGEYSWGAAQGLDTFVYLTVGTGVGGGAMIDGQLLHGLMHPEMGHIRVPHDRRLDPYNGRCRYHRDCLEGLISGPAIRKRTGRSGEALPNSHPVWRHVVRYLSYALVSYICVLSPQRIVIGGGVMGNPHLLPMLRDRTSKLLGNYIPKLAVKSGTRMSTNHYLERVDMVEYIVPPRLGDDAGVLGAIALAQRVARRRLVKVRGQPT